MCRGIPRGDERDRLLWDAHARIVQTADRFARYNVHANLLRVPEILWVFAECARSVHFELGDKALHEWREAEPDAIAKLLPVAKTT